LSSYLILDWDHDQLRVAAASVKRGQVQLHQAASWAGMGSPSPAEAESLGHKLREYLKQAGMATAPVVACVGRDRIIVKELRHPPVPPAEEPAVVRFQAIKELTDSPDDVVLDYTSLSDPSQPGERRALCWVIRKELLAAYQGICRAAGLKLQALTPRVFGTITCVRQALRQGTLPALAGPAGATAAVVTVAKPWAEFSVVRDEQILFTRSLPAGSTLVGEVRRNLIVYAGQAPQNPVAAMFVASDSTDPLHEQLRNVMGVPVHALDPFVGLASAPAAPAEGSGAFTGAVGLLQLLAERRTLPINFAQPRQPQAERDPRKRRLVAAAAAAGLVLLGTVGYCYSQLSAKDDEIERLTQEQTQLDSTLARFEQSSKQLHEINDWEKQNMDWLDELYDLAALFPDTERIRLTQITGDPIKRGPKDKDPHVAQLVLRGVTTNDARAVNELGERLAEDSDHYSISAYNPQPSSAKDKDRFPTQFTTKVQLQKIPPSHFVRRLPAAAPDDNGGDDMGGGFGGFGAFGGMGGE